KHKSGRVGGGNHKQHDQQHHQGAGHAHKWQEFQQVKETRADFLTHRVGNAALVEHFVIESRTTEGGKPQKAQHYRHADHTQHKLPDGSVARDTVDETPHK